MSKPAATVQRNPSISQLPTLSAWSRGPPQSVNTTSSSTQSIPSPRSQSPAVPANSSNQNGPQTSHSRRPSALGGNPVAVGMGVSTSVPRNASSKTASPVTFGSIDQPSAPLSSSPAQAPSVPQEGAPKVQSFGSIPSTSVQQPPAPAVNGKPLVPAASAASNSIPPRPSSSSPAMTEAKQKMKFDVKKLFQGGGQQSQSPAIPSFSQPVPQQAQQAPLPPRSPAPPMIGQIAGLPMPQLQGQPIPSHQQQQPPRQQFTPYSPVTNTRPLAGGGPGQQQQPPRSPQFARQMPNGRPGPPTSNGSSPAPHSPRIGMQVPPQGPGPGSLPGSAAAVGPPANGVNQMPMQSLPGQQHMMHPQMWQGGYYGAYQYAGMTPDQTYLGQQPSYGWAMPQQHHLPPPHQAPHLQPTHAPHSPHLAPHPPPVSPRAQPPPLSVPRPSTPSLTSPPPTNQSRPLSTGAPTFVPRPRAVITIKDSSGKEIDLGGYGHKREASVSGGASGGGVTPPLPTNLTPEKKRSSVIRMESEDDKKKRLEALEREQREKEEKEKAEKEAKERVEREKEEAEQRKRDEEERLKREEEEKERLHKEEEEKERLRLQEEEEERVRKAAAEEERLRREAEEEAERERERERLRKEEEARELKRKEEEAAEKIRKFEEEERLRKEEEENTRLRLLEEQKERERKEEEERKAAEEQKAATSSDSTPAEPVTPLEVIEPKRLRPKPGPLDLSSAQQPGIVPPLPSALATARIISNLEEISYPVGIQSPKVELNQGAQGGKFKYDRDFLLQFMVICKEKPDNLPNLDAIGLNPSESPAMGHPMTRGGSKGQNRRSSVMGPPALPGGRSNSVGLGLPGNFTNKGPGGFAMGQFMNPNARNVTGPAMVNAFPGKPGMTRTSSQGGVNPIPGQPSGLGTNRNRSTRGKNRNEANRVNSHQAPPSYGQVQMGGLEPVAPLEATANRWTPGSLGRKPQALDENSPELLDRKVKGLLNKLTLERFDSISDQIIDWANKSENETNGRTLMQVIRLVFEKATDEATWSEMYARLCRKMLEKISPAVVDESIKTNDGKPFAGGQLFRKYLLNRCQEDFERGWAHKEAASAAAAAKADDDTKANAAEQNGEEALYSEEYYVAQKAKRQGLGLVKFIGELFKLQMLTERIMHECIKKLLSNVDNPAEEEIESLCKLLSTVGQQLDIAKAQKHMDVYFTRMKELAQSPKIASRMQYMLQDVIELRERKWRARTEVAAPSTIAHVHEQAAKEKLAAEREAYARPMPMSRGGSRRGEHSRGDYQQMGPDGWTTAGGPGPGGPPRPPAKAGDLSLFGKIQKSSLSTTSFAPSGVFKKDGAASKIKEGGSLSRTASSSNMFSMLNADAAAVEPSPSRGAPSRKPSADFTQTGIPDGTGPVGRRRIQLLPRSIPKEGDETPNTPSTPVRGDSDIEEGEIREDEVSERLQTSTMSEDDAKRKVKEDVKELFAVRNLDEADEYFKALPSEYHSHLVDQVLVQVLERKETDATFIASFFSRAAEQKLCSTENFEQGFVGNLEFLDDVSVDVPAAYKLVAIVIKGAALPQDAVERLADKISAEGDPLVPPRQKLLSELEKLA